MAARTGTVLGLHAAMFPEEANIAKSQLYNPTIDKSKSLATIDFGDGGMEYFAITVSTLIVTILGLCICNICGCNQRRTMAMRERQAWKEEIKQLKLNEDMLELKAALKERVIMDQINTEEGAGDEGGATIIISGPMGHPGLQRVTGGQVGYKSGPQGLPFATNLQPASASTRPG